MPPTEQSMDGRRIPGRRANWWVRGGLIAMAASMVFVFYLATRVQPYFDDGTPMRQASHRSLGLPSCRFQEMTDLPCPSCGMTTSFALLVRGDVWNSMRANWVGTGLAVFCLLFIPWSVVSTFCGRFLWVRNVEGVLAFLVGVFTVLMLGRWVIILLLRAVD
jgi:Protein of unknown function (DUF2752)